MTETPSTVSIAMRGIELIVRIGEHPWEKFAERPTRLSINITLTFGYADYFGKLNGYVDYNPLRQFLKGLEQRDHVERLEEFSKQILAACFDTTPVERVRLSVLKPDIFHEMQGVGMEFDVTRADFSANAA
ncbi:MAG: dihydroneopterin aldolase [Hyphomonadaceae bacterium]|nr:dihydroneopterin aldolase [Hyphomonadaceae bacterium]